MRELWVATTNTGKIQEFKTLLGHLFQVRSCCELDFYTPPPETGATFLDNARLKARSLRAIKSHTWVLADDSGLEVEGLGGQPGVHSARYAGPHARDSENVAKLLKMLQIRSPMNRKAQFRCVLVGFDPEGREVVSEGVLKGSIALSARGQGGFGYDPIFIPEAQTQTLGELSLAKKNQISHRALALRDWLKTLEEQIEV